MMTKSHKIMTYPALVTVLMVLLVPVALAGTSIPDDLQIVTEDYAPNNYLDNGTLKGISVDLVEAVLHQMGSNLSRDSFQVLPWNEAYNRARTTPDTILFSTDRLSEREDLFKWAGPVTESRQVLFTLNETNNSARDISTRRIVTIIDDCGKDYAIKAGAEDVNIIAVPLARDAVSMIENGTADGWAYDELAGQTAIDTYAADPARFIIGTELGTSRYYLAFNQDTPSEFVNAVNTTLQEFKQNRSQNGTTRYERVIAQYLPVQCDTYAPDRSQVISLVNSTAAAIATDAPGTITAIQAGENPYRNQTNPDLYVFVFDTSVNLIANGVTSANIGKNLAGTTDVFGFPFRDEMVNGAIQNGTGWVSYVYSNPDSLGLYQKMSYYQYVTGSDGIGYVVGAGRYQTCDEQSSEKNS